MDESKVWERKHCVREIGNVKQNRGVTRPSQTLFQASSKWLQHWKSQASDDSTWATIQRPPGTTCDLKAQIELREARHSAKQPSSGTVCNCFDTFSIF
jgi:hypothetical protein